MDRALVGVAVTKDSMLRFAPLILLAACAASPTHTSSAPRATPSSGVIAPPPAPRDPSLTELLGSDLSGPQPAELEGFAIALPSKWPVAGTAQQTSGFVVHSGARGPYRVSIGADYATLDAPARIVKIHGTWVAGTADRIGTSVRQIEVLPIDAVAILEAAQVRWTAFLADRAADLAATLDAAAASSPGRPFGTESETSADQLVPTWDPAARVVTVTFVHVITRSSSSVTRMGGGCAKYDRRSAPAPCPPPVERPIIHQRVYSAEAALALTFSADGKLIAEHPYPLHPVPARGPF